MKKKGEIQSIKTKSSANVVPRFYKPSGDVLGVRMEWGPTWDGLLMFRFKVHNVDMVWKSGWSFKIEFEEKIVLTHVFGATINEICSCPETIEDFRKSFECPSSFDELEKSIKKFGKFDLDRIRKAGSERKHISGGKAFVFLFLGQD